MRRAFVIIGLACLASACRPGPQAGTGHSPQDDGKIPITTPSREARALFLRGRAMNENLQAHTAHLLFQQAVTADPTFAFGEYSLAATAPTAKEQAAHLQRALALAGHASPGERLLIASLQARVHGDPDRVRQVAESLVATYPADERAHWTLGNAFAAQQRYDQAIAEFKAAIAINPTYALAYNQLGYAYRSAGKWAEAGETFQRYIALLPGDPNPYDSYAELLMKSGRFDESIAQYRKALGIDPHFGGSFVGIAADEMLAGRYDAAAAEAERYLESARDDGERRTALATLAMVRVDQGATDQALAAMEKRVEIARAAGDSVNLSADEVIIGHILLEAGRVGPARERITQAHALLAASSAAADLKADDALGAHYDLARLALASGDVARARTAAVAYTTGAAARHNVARERQSHLLNGLVALAANRPDDALAELALADAQDPAVLHATSRAWARRGDATKASELASQAVHLNILPTWPYVFTRAQLAAATRSATSGSAAGTRR